MNIKQTNVRLQERSMNLMSKEEKIDDIISMLKKIEELRKKKQEINPALPTKANT